MELAGDEKPLRRRFPAGPKCAKQKWQGANITTYTLVDTTAVAPLAASKDTTPKSSVATAIDVLESVATGVGEEPPVLLPEAISGTASNCSSIDAATLEAELSATEYDAVSLKDHQFGQEKSWPVLSCKSRSHAETAVPAFSPMGSLGAMIKGTFIG